MNEVEEKDRKYENAEDGDSPDILEEIAIEDFAVDGICGVY